MNDVDPSHTDPSEDDHGAVRDAINATEEALAAATGDLEAPAVPPHVPAPPPAEGYEDAAAAPFNIEEQVVEETPIPACVPVAAPPVPVEAPPSPRGLKRAAEEQIAAAAPDGNMTAKRQATEEAVTAAVPGVGETLTTVPPDVAAMALAKKKRLCRYPGCQKVIKSQGHCQRHGARAKRCKVEACDKQAQGTHDGMCKRHWKATNFPEEAQKKGSTPPEPEGESIYDSILPMSIAYRPVHQQKTPVMEEGIGTQSPGGTKNDLLDPPAAPEGFQVMPLVAHLKEGIVAGKQAGWHRNAERRARGLFPVKGSSMQLEPWERQLALMEVLLLSGGTPYANFKELAFAWGREKGFHHVLATSVCERRGEVERKKRSDAGKSMTEEEKLAFRSKLQKSRDKNGTSRRKSREFGPDGFALEEKDDDVEEANRMEEQPTEQPPPPFEATAEDPGKAAAPMMVEETVPRIAETVEPAPVPAQGVIELAEHVEAVQAPEHTAPAEGTAHQAQEPTEPALTEQPTHLAQI